MNDRTQHNPWVVYGLIVLGVVSRLVPHLWNATPVMAIALFGGTYLSKRWAILLPLATPLYIELGDLEVTTIARRLLRPASAGGAVTAGTGLAATSGGALAFEHRDAGLARVH